MVVAVCEVRVHLGSRKETQHSVVTYSSQHVIPPPVYVTGISCCHGTQSLARE